MKTIINLAFIAFIGFSLSSCKKDDNSISNSKVLNYLEEGTWKITLFSDSGNDELYHFSGFSFTFNNGNITAVKNSTSITGSYTEGNDDNKTKLIINFGSNVPFDELNDDWNIIESTTNKIRLEDISGGNGGTDLLTFEKV